ncbi:MAG: HAMP domain-containing protein [Eubacteriaceae bacterium]
MESGQSRRSIKTRILIIPLICVFAGVLILGALTAYFTQKSMKEQMRDNGVASAQQVVNQIEFNQAATDALNETLGSRLESIGKIILANEGNITDEYLSSLADQTGVTAIYWYNPQGTVVNAAYGEYLGWTVPTDHVIYAYMQSGESVLIEDIRKDTDSDNYYKYGYIRSASGSFAQIGISADVVSALTDQFGYQAMVEKLAASDQVSFASFIDADLNVAADTNQEKIGTSFAEVESMKNAVVDGTVSAEEIVDNGQDIYLLVYPVEINGERIGALNIGYTMTPVEAAISGNITTTVIAGIIIFVLLALILLNASNSVVKPVKEINGMVKEFRQGHLSTRLNINRDDEIGEMAQTLDAFADELQFEIMGALKKLADGDVSTDMEVRDELDEIAPVINNTVKSIRALVDETNMISQAVQAGELDKRADADAFKGGFKDVINGVNATMDAINSLLEIISNNMSQIAKGQIPDKITQDYTGAYEVMKQQINDSIEGLSALEESNRVLKQLSLNDLSQIIEKDYQGIYGEIGQAVNTVHKQLERVVETSIHISQGNFIDLENMKAIGKRSENDNLMPSLIAMIENIKMLVEETQLMAQNAVAGEFNIVVMKQKCPVNMPISLLALTRPLMP